MDTKTGNKLKKRVKTEKTLEERNKYLKRLVQSLMFKVPAFSSLLTYIPRRATEDGSFVAYTDGKVIHCCNSFFENYEPGEQAFILLHESLHVVLRHVTRYRQFYTNNDAMLWNLCTDCIINYTLGSENNNIGSEFNDIIVPKNNFNFTALNKVLELKGEDLIKPYNDRRKDQKVIDWSAEELFKVCKDKINKSPNKEKIEKKLEQAGNKDKGGSNGSGKGEGETELDSEMLGDLKEKDLEGEELSEVDDLPGADSGRVGDLIWAKRVKSAAGQDPSGVLKTLIGDLPTSKVDWKAKLRQYISSTLLPEPKTDWRRPSRRTLSGDIDYFTPNRGRERGIKTIAIFHDASGSCWDQDTVMQFLSNIESVQKKMKADLLYMPFDCTIHEQTKVPYDGVPLSKKLERGSLKVYGGGGTSFEPCIEWLKDNKPDVAIIFTDTYAPMPSSKPSVPFIWAVVDNFEFEAPFGKVVFIEKDIFKR